MTEEERRTLRDKNHCCTTCGSTKKPTAINTVDGAVEGIRLKEIGKCSKCDAWTTVPCVWLINHIQILIKKVDKLDNRLQILETSKNKDVTIHQLEKEE